MYACQLISGCGGWPLNAFALALMVNLFLQALIIAKTGWMSLLTNISKAYKEKHDLVVKQADGLTKGIADEEFSLIKLTVVLLS
jgi:uncharacterized protein YyaL (SSP411 family)